MRILNPIVAEWINVEVIDVSRGGLRVRTPVFLQAGTLIQVKIKRSIVLGEVRYCVSADGGFHAGVQIQDLQ